MNFVRVNVSYCCWFLLNVTSLTFPLVLFGCVIDLILELSLKFLWHVKTLICYIFQANSTLFKSLITDFVIGYGNIVPRTSNGRLFCIFYALIGIPLTCLTLKTIGEKLRDVMTSVIQNMKKRIDGSNAESVRKGIVFSINVFLWFITLVLLSILARWRRGWTMLESFYFCFITFSTIGFGDFVAFDDHEANTFADYFVVFLGVVLGFAVTSTVLFSFGSLMEDKSQETRLVEKFRDFKKRLTASNRIAVAKTLNTPAEEECEEITKKEATVKENKWRLIKGNKARLTLK